MKKMLSMVLALCMLLSMLPVGTFAAEQNTAAQTDAGTMIFGVDGVATLYLEDGSVKTFTGWMTEIYEIEDDYEINGGGFMTTTPWWEYSWEITKVIIEDGVCPVSTAYWFPCCPNLTDVTIGNGITSIGDYAFAYSTMAEVIIPAGVTTIGKSAFEFSELKTIALPASLKRIEDCAFQDCYNLNTVIYCGNNYFISNVYTGMYNDPLWYAWVEYHLFEKDRCVVCGSEYLGQGSCGDNLTWTLTPDGLLTISGTGAMQWEGNEVPWNYCDKEKITAVVIEEGVTTIGYRAFNYCTKLRSVSIPSGIISIGDSAFESCYDLQSFSIPDGVQTIGANAFSGCMDATGHLVIPDSVTSIGEAAFSSCMSLTGVTIGSGITEIKDSTFGGCSGLKEITIPNGITTIGQWAFHTCGFTQVTIPASVTSIAGNAFSWCESLTAFVVDEENTAFSTDAQGILYDKGKTLLITAPCTITSCTVPNTVLTIGSHAFDYCFDLTSLTLCEGLVTIEEYAFWATGLTELTIPDSVTTIGVQAFASCYNMTSAILGNGVTHVGDYAFGDAYLTFLRLPGSIEYIGSEAFRDSLTKVVYCGTAEQWAQVQNETREYIFSRVLQFHEMQDGVCIYCSASDEVATEGSCGDNLTWSFADGVLTISGTGDMWDFQWISDDLNSTPWAPLEITEVRIENGVTYIGTRAFDGCTSLTTVTIAPSVTSIGMYAFSDCTSLTAIDIPASVTSIGDYAFSDCSSLTEIVIPDSVTSVGEYVFWECTGLTKVTIGKGITKIAAYMFAYCKNLTSVSIPDGITLIDYGAFNGCNALTMVRIPVSVTNIGYESFKNCSNLTTVIYCGTPEQWENIWIMTYNNGFLLNADRKYHDFQDGVCIYCGLAGEGHVWMAATCTTPKTCSICGATEGEALGHSFSCDIAVVPTQNTEGLLIGSCKNCSEGLTIVMPAISEAAYTCTTQADPTEQGWGIATYVWNEKTYGEYTFHVTFRYGDVNGDDIVDLVDVLMLRKYLANLDPITGESNVEIGVGTDVNGDDVVDLIDVLMLRKYLVNLDPITGESSIVLGPQ